MDPVCSEGPRTGVQCFRVTQAVGPDKISARLLKDSVDVITPSLTNLQINIHTSQVLKFLKSEIFAEDYAKG